MEFNSFIIKTIRRLKINKVQIVIINVNKFKY